MERIVPGAQGGARTRADLVGTSVFWLTIAVTLCALVPFSLFPIMRAWLAVAVLLMWACFFTANAVRSHRTHSIISAPVYFLAAALLAGSAWGLIAVDVWMVWCSAPASSPRICRNASLENICNVSGSKAFVSPSYRLPAISLPRCYLRSFLCARCSRKYST